jgi:predicted ATPase/signal transduction histidine kinase
MAINCWNVFSKQYYWGENNLLEVLVKPSPGMRGSRPHRFPAEAAAQPAAKLFRELVLQSAMSMQDADRTEDDRKTEMELSGLSLEVLRRGDYALYRLKPDSGEKNLLVIPSLEAVTSNSRLQHELGLKAELDAKWAAQPIALERHNGRLALVLSDPGGEPLDRLIGRPLDLTRFLQMAVSVAAALRATHERGLVHRDIKPANILIASNGSRAWLTGFGIASLLVREHRVPEPPDFIAGTLAYMAPEQTGRMNRATDARSDLYALGVTFYELLTGSLPFTAADPIELIHSHIAREPVAPSDLPYGVPKPVSSIVMKLLAKAPESRYQTAIGLEADLRTCLEALEKAAEIQPFPLGTSDAPDQLVVPERLYGRDNQLATLLGAFDRVAASGATNLVLVSGYSGIGKSSVVNELHKVIVLPRGIFISGKFDQRSRDIPYSTMAEAFQALIRQILNGKATEIARWRDAILHAVGVNGRLLSDLIPELVRMIGPQPDVPELAPFDAQLRFQDVFQRFVSVFARPEHPLLIFIDDLQWLDPETLALIQTLATHPDLGHLLLIGAYRENEVGPDHMLLRMVAAVRQAETPVEEIALGPISLNDVTQIVADALRCSTSRVRRLSSLIYRKTGGNPFFAVQFLTNLAEEGLIRLDPMSRAWTWDLQGIDAKGFTDNLVDLMVGRLRRLPSETQDALKLLGCLGNSADIALLELLLCLTRAELNACLRIAVQSGIIVSRGGQYRFLHDRIQEAAYALISPDIRAAFHFRVGKRLLTELRESEVSESIYDIVNQLNLGIRAVTHVDDKAQIAQLNLQAGIRAKSSTAYASACNYFSFGLSTLGEEGWEHSYDLALKLLFERAECELLRGKLATSGEQIELLLSKAKSKVDRTDGYRLQITLQLLYGDMDQAVRVALNCLKMFDMTFPEHPTAEDVRSEYQDLQQLMGSRTIESLLELPLMEDPEMQAVSSVLLALGQSSYFVDEHLFCLFAFRMVKLSIEFGHSASCFVGYGGVGIMLGPVFNRFEDGEHFARVAVALTEKYGFVAQQPATYLLLQMASLWIRPIEEAVACLDSTDKVARETGEVVFACLSAEHRVTNLLARGDTLDVIWPTTVNSLAFVRKKGYAHVIDVLLAIQKFVATLRGDTTIEGPDEQALLRSGLPVVCCFYWILQLQLRYLMGDVTAALDAAEKARPTLWSARCHIQTGTYHFYHALAALASNRSVPAAVSDALEQDVTDSISALRRLSKAAPHTYSHKYLLVAAEIAKREGQDLKAMRLYEQAIRMALEKGFIQEAALGADLAADFSVSRGLEKVAQTYRREARDYYRRWGALAKVTNLERRHPDVAPPISEPHLPTFETSLKHLDLATVIRMSQAVAGELLLDRLIQALMTITIEHAGADRGLLMLPHGDELIAEAEAKNTADSIDVRLIGDQDPVPDLPASILAQVRRTQKPVILDDARGKTPFSADRYLRLNRARSVLCLPLVKQGELIGILYLENSLASHVFTSTRIEVLRLLSSQIAISLDNASLYADLVTENKERQKAEEALREAQTELARVARLTTVGELVASIAHEINQPLTAASIQARASVNWLNRIPPNLDEAGEALKLIDRNVQRAADVIRSLRAMVTKSEANRAWIDINDVIREVLALTRTELHKYRITTTTDLFAGAPAVYVDRVQLLQVMLNLIVNGVEAVCTAEGTRQLTIGSRLSAEGEIHVSVADTGAGVDAETIDRVFVSFFTTKAAGMGMGLSICRSIIGAHGGRIWVEKNEPRGAVFHFTLPIYTSPRLA